MPPKQQQKTEPEEKAPSATSGGVSKTALHNLQTSSGIFFSVFLCMHIIGTSSAAFGEQTFNETLALFRNVYQNPIFEFLLFLNVLLHLGAGSILHWRRDKFGLAKAPPARWYVRVQRISGSILTVILLAHVSSTRLPVLLGKHRPLDFAELHVLLRTAPGFAFAYCAIYVLCAVLHMMLGLPQLLERLRILPGGSHHRIATHWIFWLLMATTTASLYAGIWALWETIPANKADLEYWAPFVRANVPPIFQTPYP